MSISSRKGTIPAMLNLGWGGGIGDLISARVGGHRGLCKSRRVRPSFRVSDLPKGQEGRVLEESGGIRKAPFPVQIESLVNNVFFEVALD